MRARVASPRLAPRERTRLSRCAPCFLFATRGTIALNVHGARETTLAIGSARGVSRRGRVRARARDPARAVFVEIAARRAQERGDLSALGRERDEEALCERR